MLRLSSSPSSSACSIIRSAVRQRISPRLAAVNRIQRFSLKAARAAATAASTSACRPRATSAITSPVPGSYVGNTWPSAAGTQLPSISNPVASRPVGVEVTRLCTVIVIRFSFSTSGREPPRKAGHIANWANGGPVLRKWGTCRQSLRLEPRTTPTATPAGSGRRGATWGDVVTWGRRDPRTTRNLCPSAGRQLDVDSAHLRIGNAEGMFGAGLAPASILCTSVGTGTARHIANPLERLSYIRTTERNAERMNCIQGGRLRQRVWPDCRPRKSSSSRPPASERNPAGVRSATHRPGRDFLTRPRPEASVGFLILNCRSYIRL